MDTAVILYNDKFTKYKHSELLMNKYHVVVMTKLVKANIRPARTFCSLYFKAAFKTRKRQRLGEIQKLR